MKVEFVNPFIEAACEVLESELGGEAQRGEVRLQKSAITTDEVTALVGVTGTVSGLVLYSMSLATAVALALFMLGANSARASWDLSENRRNSFSRADEAALRQIRQPLRMMVFLAPEDPRLSDLEQNVLLARGLQESPHHPIGERRVWEPVRVNAG